MRPPVFFDDHFLVKQWKTSLAPERLVYRAGRGWVPCTDGVGARESRTSRARSLLSTLSIVALGGWALSRLLGARRRQGVAPMNLRVVRGRRAA